MIHEIAHSVYRLIREYGMLTHEEVATAIDRKHQVISRWEGAQQQLLPKRAQEAILVKRAKLTRPAFGDIMCGVLTAFVGRRFTMEPPGAYTSSLPLSRAMEDYRLNRDLLGLEDQQAIEEMLDQGRALDAGVARACSIFEREIRRKIERAQAAKGKRPSSSGGNDGDGSDGNDGDGSDDN